MRGVFVHRFPTAEAPNLAAQGQSVSRKTVAEVPLTGLSLEYLTPLLKTEPFTDVEGFAHGQLAAQ
jgi:hypothetical protein